MKEIRDKSSSKTIVETVIKKYDRRKDAVGIWSTKEIRKQIVTNYFDENGNYLGNEIKES